MINEVSILKHMSFKLICSKIIIKSVNRIKLLQFDKQNFKTVIELSQVKIGLT